MIPRTIEPERQIADWSRLFSDERFIPGRMDRQAYSDHNFIREYCRLGFERFVTNSIDEALLQLFSVAAQNGVPAIIGAPYTPCHWGALAVLLHLFRDGNEYLNDKRVIYWMTTERGERSLFARLRIQGRMRRVLEAVEVYHSPEEYDESISRTSLVFVRELSHLTGVQPGATVIVSDPRGELVFRKGEVETLFNQLVSLDSTVTLIVPSAKVTYALGTEAIVWPWSEAALASAHIRKRHYGDDIPWKWEAGAEHAGQVERGVLSLEGANFIEEPLLQLKSLAYKLFSKPKNVRDLISRTEFQRIVGVFRQLVVPFEDFDRGDDERRLSARLKRLSETAEGCSKEVAEEIAIGLLYARDLIKQLQYSDGKWALLRARIDACIADSTPVALAFPQADPFSAERTLEFVRSYAERNGGKLEVSVLEGPDFLPYFEGEVVLAGVPKLSMASRWRTPFIGRLTILAWQFDRFFADMALHEANASAESIRRRTWSDYFVTPIDSYDSKLSDVPLMSVTTERIESEEIDGEIEAFDLSYRGVTSSVDVSSANVLKGRAEYFIVLDDGSTLSANAAERHHVLLKGYGGGTVKAKMTADLKNGDQLILINGESYDHLSKRLQDEVDRASSRLSFNEMFDEWKMLCLEQDETEEIRSAFLERVTQEFKCKRDRGTIVSWLRWKVWGPAALEDILAAALAAGNYDLARNAKLFWQGLEEQRSRHRRLGVWLKKVIARSAAVEPSDFEKVIDTTLELTLGDLKRGVSLKTIAQIIRPVAAHGDE